MVCFSKCFLSRSRITFSAESPTCVRGSTRRCVRHTYQCAIYVNYVSVCCVVSCCVPVCTPSRLAIYIEIVLVLQFYSSYCLTVRRGNSISFKTRQGARNHEQHYSYYSLKCRTSHVQEDSVFCFRILLRLIWQGNKQKKIQYR